MSKEMAVPFSIGGKILLRKVPYMVYSDLRSHRFTLQLISYIIAQIGTRKKALPRNARMESLLCCRFYHQSPVTGHQSFLISLYSLTRPFSMARLFGMAGLTV